DARAKGAQILTGGTADGLFVQPTVVRGVTPDMRIYGEESFGPVVSIIEVDSTDEAVTVATTPSTGSPPRSSARTRPRRSTWLAGSSPASATSTAPPCTTSPRCPSVVSAPAA